MMDSMALKNIPNAGSRKIVITAKLSKVLPLNPIPIRTNESKMYRGKASNSPLITAISHVVELSSKKKVVWPYASFIIALMADIQFLIKGAVCKFIGNPMGHKSTSGTMWAFAKNAISIGVFNAFPLPALSGFINLRPKSLFDRHITRHQLFSFLSGNVTKGTFQCQV